MVNRPKWHIDAKLYLALGETLVPDFKVRACSVIPQHRLECREAMRVVEKSLYLSQAEIFSARRGRNIQ